MLTVRTVMFTKLTDKHYCYYKHFLFETLSNVMTVLSATRWKLHWYPQNQAL